MDRAGLWVSILAAVFAGLAAAFAGWSAWASHRSARSAAAAVGLERDRIHRELTPRIELEQAGAAGADDEGVWFINTGPLDYESVTFALIQEENDRPIAGFIRGDDVLTLGDLGPLHIGVRRFMRYRRPDPEEGGGTLHLRLFCRNDRGEWTIPAKVEIPGIPQIWVEWR